MNKAIEMPLNVGVIISRPKYTCRKHGIIDQAITFNLDGNDNTQIICMFCVRDDVVERFGTVEPVDG